MSEFVGKWKYIRKSNNERIFELYGCAADLVSRISPLLETLSIEHTWDSGTNTLGVCSQIGDVKNESQRKLGETFNIGPYAPGYTGEVTSLSKDCWVAKIKNPAGEEVGTTQGKVEGNNMTTETTLNGETGHTVFERTT